VLSLSQTTGYAIMALSCLDPTKETLVLERDIATKTGISKPYLSKLLHRLGQAGLIETKRGNKGGVGLAHSPQSITVMDVFVAIEGNAWQDRCLLGLPTCGGKIPCPLHDFWLHERETILNKFSSVSLDQVMEVQKQGWHLERILQTEE
jgi:Rrf2 family transcriptional regulator, iron-sulfur cluster assembly transcription factor